MDRATPFSYQCNQCGLCCHDKVVTLSPYDVLRIARVAAVTTSEAVRRFTVRRGSILKFLDGGACSALEGTRCGIHGGRPLACRVYPLGIERTPSGERLIALEPAAGSLGVYGTDSTAGEFIDRNAIAAHLAALEKYRRLIAKFRARVASLVDFERVEPREFWRRAVVEALLENGFDPNPLIDAIFDPDGLGCAGDDDSVIDAHARALGALAESEQDAEMLAAAAVMLAVSLGYAPGEVIVADRK